MKRATVRDTFFNSSLFISIHALVKRATYMAFRNTTFGDISIHALVKRATGSGGASGSDDSDFNPRPREEGDRLGVYPPV